MTNIYFCIISTCKPKPHTLILCIDVLCRWPLGVIYLSTDGFVVFIFLLLSHPQVPVGPCRAAGTSRFIMPSYPIVYGWLVTCSSGTLSEPCTACFGWPRTRTGIKELVQILSQRGKIEPIVVCFNWFLYPFNYYSAAVGVA